MITTLFIIVIIGYAAQMLLLRIGLSRADQAERIDGYVPSVSVIVAARNEEHFIGECLSSLGSLNYPHEKLEIIIVDDGSTDTTSDIITTFAEHHLRIQHISIRQTIGNLRGKTNAVAQGIERSSGEIIMFTDADCTVSPDWVRETVPYFQENIGIVGGFTILKAERMFEGIQTLDWIFLFSLASSMAGWNLPLTAIGNNFAVRRKAYDAVGGYSQIPFSVTEDYALVRAIYKRTDYKVRFPLNPHAVVKSSACQTFVHLFHQKQRWGVGGLDMIFRGVFIMSVGWLAKLALLTIGIILGIPLLLPAAGVICLAELVFLWKPLSRFQQTKHLQYFLAFELYLALYVLILPFIAYFSKKIIWKERTL